MTRKWALAACALATVSLAACESDSTNTVGPRGRAEFNRYVAIGTSISMGWQSNGVVAETQLRSWPAYLAQQAGSPLNIPQIAAPGCPPPLIAPLQLGRVLSGRSASPADTTCAGLRTGFPLPGATTTYTNLAISGARTSDALRLTPAQAATGTSRQNRQLYRLVLGANQSQVTAAMALAPSFVSVELGANEVLGAATTGLLVPGATFVPYEAWEPDYTAIVDSVVKVSARGVLLTVPNVTSIPSVRRGAELYDNRAELQATGIIVNANCQNSENLVFTPSKILGLFGRVAAGLGAQSLSCADTPGSQDNILTPADVATLTALVGRMNARIVELAAARNYALVDANAVLSGFVAENPLFSVRKQLGCSFPYGQYISLDGVHPNGFGHQVVANAAADAINAKYGFTIPKTTVAVLTAAQQCT